MIDVQMHNHRSFCIMCDTYPQYTYSSMHGRPTVNHYITIRVWIVSGGGGAHIWNWISSSYKQSHAIRVVFQDRVMYTHTSFRGAKTCKLEKGVCFWSCVQILERTWWTNLEKKKDMQKWVFGVYFIPGNMWLECFLKVLLWEWYPPQNKSAPPPLVIEENRFNFTLL